MPQQRYIPTNPSRLCPFRVSRAKARIDAGFYDRPEISRVAVAEVVEKILDEAEVDALLDGFPYSMPDEDQSAEVEDELGDRWDGLS